MFRQQARTIKAIKAQLDLQVKNADDDRERIVASLHDDIGPYLSTLGQKIDLIKYRPQRRDELVDEAYQLSRHITENIRNISRLLLPYNVFTHSLKQAIHIFLQRLKSDQVKIIFSCSEIPPLQQEFVMAVSRLIQEIIHNSLKHSKAAVLRVEVSYRDKVISIRTAESGKSERKALSDSSSPGIGKELMDSRIRLLHGTLHSTYSVSQGVRYMINIPVSNKEYYHEEGDQNSNS